MARRIPRASKSSGCFELHTPSRLLLSLRLSPSALLFRSNLCCLLV